VARCAFCNPRFVRAVHARSPAQEGPISTHAASPPPLVRGWWGGGARGVLGHPGGSLRFAPSRTPRAHPHIPPEGEGGAPRMGGATNPRPLGTDQAGGDWHSPRPAFTPRPPALPPPCHKAGGWVGALGWGADRRASPRPRPLFSHGIGALPPKRALRFPGYYWGAGGGGETQPGRQVGGPVAHAIGDHPSGGRDPKSTHATEQRPPTATPSPGRLPVWPVSAIVGGQPHPHPPARAPSVTRYPSVLRLARPFRARWVPGRFRRRLSWQGGQPPSPARDPSATRYPSVLRRGLFVLGGSQAVSGVGSLGRGPPPLEVLQ
jgi:hypothetical protein